MAARDVILENKHDIREMQIRARGHDPKRPTDQDLADALFDNFVTYAKDHWHYLAQPGSQTAHGALQSIGTVEVACGTIREALKIMMRDVLGFNATNADINSHFITKPGLKCFDSRVSGNLVSESGQVLGCHFSTHYFLRYGRRWYDPCLTSMYVTPEGCIHAKTKPVGDLPRKAVDGLKKVGSGPQLILLWMEKKPVFGFGSRWTIVKPQDLKRLLPGEEYSKAKLDPDLKKLLP